MEKKKRRYLPLYVGPDFEEFCIAEGAYLPASRDRIKCLSCSLFELCDAGFEEQKRLARLGRNPSLTDDAVFDDEALTREALLEGLTREQSDFVLRKIPNP